MGTTEWHYCGVTAAGRSSSALTRLCAPRTRAWAALAGAVMLAHAWLLHGLPPGPGPGWQAPGPRPLQVRQIAPAAPAPHTPAPEPRPDPQATPAPAKAPQAGPSAIPDGPAAPFVQPQPQPQAQAPTDSETSMPGGQPIPIYRTQLPPPARLQYELRRGPAQGTAELRWSPEPGRYRLSLQGDVPRPSALGWASQGGFDEAGIAPLRYAESRRGREARATNFQRDDSRVTFSGPSVEYPLTAGAQDRLSWMLQLAGILAADPGLAEAERQVSMWVTGTRGDGEVWTFTVQGAAALELPIGRVDGTVHLVREARRPYDTQVQVWLDPARHYLPVQVEWRVRASGEGQALRLQASEVPALK